MNQESFSIACVNSMNRFLILPTAFVFCLFCSCNKSEEKTEENAATESNKALVELKKEREELDKTVFADETKAVQHEQVFITLWDRLRNEDPLKVLNQFEFKTLIFGNLTPQESPDWGIEGITICLLYTSPSPRDGLLSRMPSSA